MRYYDVFNGDADGLCALHQLRLADPVDSEIVTGLKRDIELLKYVPAVDGDVVTVLDISLDRNREGLAELLARGVVVLYFDHHFAGPIPQHPLLNAMIDESGATCTSALVDRHLRGRFRAWAVAGAFGDNMPEVAANLAGSLDIDALGVERLRELGEALNYNAYGNSERDVLVAPRDLYATLSHYADPFELLDREPLIAQLYKERSADLDRAIGLPPVLSSRGAEAYVLPDAPWSRRVSGTFANRLALMEPHRAHAVLVPVPGEGYSVSVRSPRQGDATSAVEFCRRYPGGGGRLSAAGIEHLDPAGVEGFIASFAQTWHA